MAVVWMRRGWQREDSKHKWLGEEEHNIKMETYQSETGTCIGVNSEDKEIISDNHDGEETRQDSVLEHI